MKYDIPNTVIEDDLLIPVFIKSPNFTVKDSENTFTKICPQSLRLHHKVKNLFLFRKKTKAEKLPLPPQN